MHKSMWIGRRFAAFRRVGMAFEALGYQRPRGDNGSRTSTEGAYVSNIVSQYVFDLSEREVLAIIEYGLQNSISQLHSDIKRGITIAEIMS